MTNQQINKGLAIHAHHDVLCEYCYNYQERKDYIKSDKPKREQEIRLRLFKILPKKALKDNPKYWQKAYAEYWKAHAKYLEYLEVDAECQKTDTEWQKAYAECRKAYAEYQKADARWPQKSKNAFHKKWCGCKNWVNGKLVLRDKSITALQPKP